MQISVVLLDMGQLICDLDSDDEVFIAVQTILNAFADIKKKLGKMENLREERDTLANMVKKLELVVKGLEETSLEKNKQQQPLSNGLSPSRVIGCSNKQLNTRQKDSMHSEDDEIGSSQPEPNFCLKNNLSVLCAQRKKRKKYKKKTASVAQSSITTTTTNVETFCAAIPMRIANDGTPPEKTNDNRNDDSVVFINDDHKKVITIESDDTIQKAFGINQFVFAQFV